jgi:branched-chain amino acid transport system ATP-binding protein
MSLLDVDGLESGYGDLTVVHDVDLQVDSDEMVAIIGPNGAGKSTLLKSISGLLTATSGTVTFDGAEITGLPPEEVIYEGICHVPQSDNVFPSLTVRENLQMGAWTLSDGADFEDRVGEVYERFPVLEERAGQRAGTLSGGQRQMVAMGSVLMLDPDLLILDEPSAGLAPQLVDDVFEKVVEINEAGTAILMVEQNARRALKEADRGIVLDQGENRFEGRGEELLEDEEVIDLYLGSA